MSPLSLAFPRVGELFPYGTKLRLPILFAIDTGLPSVLVNILEFSSRLITSPNSKLILVDDRFDITDCRRVLVVVVVKFVEAAILPSVGEAYD